MKDCSVGYSIRASLAVLLMYSAASGVARPLARVGGEELEEDPLCTAKWNYSLCVPFNNKCGAGYRLAVRSGDLCRVLTQLDACTAPCIETHGAIHVGATHFNRNKRGPNNKERRKQENPGRAPPFSSAGGGQKALSAPAALSAAEAVVAAAEPGVAGEVDYAAHKQGSLYVLDGCTYRVGGWQACSVVSLSRQREDHLLSEPAASAVRCSERKIVTMDCSLREIGSAPEINHTRADCRYSYGKWSKCDEATSHRVRQQRLLSGGTGCAPEVEIRKPCYDRIGRERCFYGRWSPWTPCIDNVKSRSREVVFGGEKCLKMTVKKSVCPPAEKR